MKKCTASVVLFNPNIKRVKMTLDSLVSDNPDIPITVIDNSPSKHDLEFKDFTNLKYHWVGKNVGFGTGHNLALKMTEPSQYHIYVNPDITVKKNCTQILMSFLDSNPSVGMVGPKTLNPDGSLQYSCKRNPTIFALFMRMILKRKIQKYHFLKDYNAKYEMQDFGYDKVFSTSYLSGCFMMCRRSVIEQLKGFDEDYFLHFEDADLSRRVSNISKVCFVPEAEVIHDWLAGNHKSLKLNLIMLQSAFVYFKKWGLRLWSF